MKSVEVKIWKEQLTVTIALEWILVTYAGEQALPAEIESLKTPLA